MKGALALIDIYERKAAPLHLFLGSDAFAGATAKLDAVRAELTAYKAVSGSTDF